MIEIVVASDYQKLKDFLNHSSKRFNYIFLSENFIEFQKLLDDKKYKQIKIENKSDESKDKFMHEYLDMIGKLSNKYNSIYWWATTISSKNPFISELYSNVFYYYHIIKYFEKYPNENLILVSNEHIVNNSIKIYCARHSIKYIYLGKIALQEKFIIIKKIVYHIMIDIVKFWKKKYLAHKYLDKKIKNNFTSQKKYYVLRSWFYDKSIFNNEYKDSYFGKLPQYLNIHVERFIIIACILGNYSELIKKISKYKDILIIPQEYFINYLDYVIATMKFIFNRIKIDEKCILMDVDVTNLIKKELKKNYYNFEIRMNIIYYYIIKRLTEQINVDTFLFDFENHSWEKICILSFKKYSPDTKIIGYQHASISKSYLNFFPSKFEKQIIPLPDKIISMGNETKKIMEKYGVYNNNIQNGCALRFEYLYKSKLLERKKRNTIFVPLTITKEESIKLIKFIYNGLCTDKNYKIIIRSHPAMPFDIIKKDLKLKLGYNFQVASETTNMLDNFKSSDIILYTSTTVGAEALMMGLPAVHINLGNAIDVDPLSACNHLKWTISNKNDLIKTINEIYTLNDLEFKNQQKLARNYIKNYFLPVTDECLKKFIE